VLIAVYDVRSRRIPNAAVLVLASGGIMHAAFAAGARGALAAVLGVVAGMALLYYQFVRGWMGAGDVKLLGAIGSVTGVLGVVIVLLAGSVLGGLLSMIAMARLPKQERKDVRQRLLSSVISGDLLPADEATRLPHHRGVPYGVALAAAAAGYAVVRIIL
jgi:prepilin peptidase CpaA